MSKNDLFFTFSKLYKNELPEHPKSRPLLYFWNLFKLYKIISNLHLIPGDISYSNSDREEKLVWAS